MHKQCPYFIRLPSQADNWMYMYLTFKKPSMFYVVSKEVWKELVSEFDSWSTFGVCVITNV